MTFALSTFDALESALARSTSVLASSYVLSPAMERDLGDAATRGAAVDVVLANGAAAPGGDRLAALNAAAAQRLRARGASVRLEPATHLKAAVVDGVAWLDDRNFAVRGASELVRDDEPGDVDRIRAAITSSAVPAAPGEAGIALSKAAALASEAALLDAPSAVVSLASESFGFGEVTSAVRRCVSAGEHVRLLVDRAEAASSREAFALDAMATLGVEIRVGETADKVALAGDRAWLGSANATYAGSNVAAQSDWGLVTSDISIVRDLSSRYDAAWSAARPRPVAQPPNS